MKKFLTAIAAVLAVFSANALTVTYEGKPVTEGQVIKFVASDFKQDVPVPVIPWNCKADFVVTSGSQYTLSGRINASALDNGENLQLCGSTCLTCTIQGEYGILPETASTQSGFDVNMVYPATTGVVANEYNWMEVKVAQGGETLNFKVEFDTRDNAGIEDVAVDAEGKYVAYTISGIKALETTNKADINNLPAGLYIVNGVKIFVK